MTGAIYDEITEDFAILIDRPDGEICEGYAPTAEQAGRRLSEALARWQRHDKEHAVQVAFVAQRSESKQQPPKQRCPWHRVIKRFYAICEDRGLDTSDNERIRAAIFRFFGKEIESRSTLTATEWFEAGSAVKRRQLSW